MILFRCTETDFPSCILKPYNHCKNRVWLIVFAHYCSLSIYHISFAVVLSMSKGFAPSVTLFKMSLLGHSVSCTLIFLPINQENFCPGHDWMGAIARHFLSMQTAIYNFAHLGIWTLRKLDTLIFCWAILPTPLPLVLELVEPLAGPLESLADMLECLLSWLALSLFCSWQVAAHLFALV